MKFYCLFCILLVALFTINAKSISSDNENSKTKRAETETSDECKYINSMLGKGESDNCCEYYDYKWGYYGILCKNGHIIEM